MTIYIDIILIENIVMNCIILLSTSVISKTKINKIRIFLSSLLGSIYSIFEYMFSFEIYSNQLMKTTSADKTWWTQVTQYPITTTVTIKGLLKPIILMTVIKLNVLFYGRKHLSTGYYIVTKQIDTINSSGYRTQLKLTRIKGE